MCNIFGNYQKKKNRVSDKSAIRIPSTFFPIFFFLITLTRENE